MRLAVLVASTAPRPVPDEVQGHRHTGGEKCGDTPRRRVTTSLLARVRKHASRYGRSEGDGHQERDGIRPGHDGHDTAARRTYDMRDPPVS